MKRHMVFVDIRCANKQHNKFSRLSFASHKCLADDNRVDELAVDKLTHLGGACGGHSTPRVARQELGRHWLLTLILVGVAPWYVGPVTRRQLTESQFVLFVAGSEIGRAHV